VAGTQRVNRWLLLSGSRGPRTVWRFRNIEGSRRLDDARKVITDKKEPSDVGGAREASLRSSHLSTEDRMDRIFTAFARTIASWTGQPLAFIFALLLIVLWIICGPIFQFSDTWQLVVNTATTIIRSEEHTSELQSLMRISYAVFCLKKKTNQTTKK